MWLFTKLKSVKETLSTNIFLKKIQEVEHLFWTFGITSTELLL